jgi:hypothetical protein
MVTINSIRNFRTVQIRVKEKMAAATTVQRTIHG